MRRKLFIGLPALLVAGAVAVPALGASTTVKVGDNYFVHPGGATVTVHHGGSLTWKWAGSARHNVTVKSGPQRFASKTLGHGASYSHRFTAKGTYTIYCTIHGAAMSMKVKVT